MATSCMFVLLGSVSFFCHKKVQPLHVFRESFVAREYWSNASFGRRAWEGSAVLSWEEMFCCVTGGRRKFVDFVPFFSQLMVTCWFGLVVWIPIIPL